MTGHHNFNVWLDHGGALQFHAATSAPTLLAGFATTRVSRTAEPLQDGVTAPLGAGESPTEPAVRFGNAVSGVRAGART